LLLPCPSKEESERPCNNLRGGLTEKEYKKTVNFHLTIGRKKFIKFCLGRSCYTTYLHSNLLSIRGGTVSQKGNISLHRSGGEEKKISSSNVKVSSLSRQKEDKRGIFYPSSIEKERMTF